MTLVLTCGKMCLSRTLILGQTLSYQQKQYEKNVVALGLNLFTTIVSGKGTVTSGKNIKKMIGTDVGNKWGNKANNKPLLEYNLQFFGDKSGGKTGKLTIIDGENYSTSIKVFN